MLLLEIVSLHTPHAWWKMLPEKPMYKSAIRRGGQAAYEAPHCCCIGPDKKCIKK